MRTFWICLALFAGLLLIASEVGAQDANCGASVWYGAPKGVAGRDEGLCDSSAKACATFEYALSQGQVQCKQLVAVFFEDQNKNYQAAKWVAQSANWPSEIGFWSIPLITLVIGLVAGWWWQMRGSGGVA